VTPPEAPHTIFLSPQLVFFPSPLLNLHCWRLVIFHPLYGAFPLFFEFLPFTLPLTFRAPVLSAVLRSISRKPNLLECRGNLALCPVFVPTVFFLLYRVTTFEERAFWMSARLSRFLSLRVSFVFEQARGASHLF